MTLQARHSAELNLPRGHSIRRGRPEDEAATFEVMRRTMGADMSWSQHAATRHYLRTSLGASFWVAEESPLFGADKIVGYARSVVRDRVWSLTEFFILPGHQRQGIGKALLTCCLRDGATTGMDTRMVLASHHPGADSLYIRVAGCFARVPMMFISGALQRLQLLPEGVLTISDTLSGGPCDVIAQPVVHTQAVLEEIGSLDREIVGYTRSTDHVHWAAIADGATGASRLFRQAIGGRPGALIGYAYLGRDGTGPALAIHPSHLPHFVQHVSSIQVGIESRGSEWEYATRHERFWAVPGINEPMLRWLLDCGWQIAYQYLYMSSRPLGRMDRYAGYNPLYLL